MELNGYLREVSKDIMAAVAPSELILRRSARFRFGRPRHPGGADHQ